MSRFQVNDTDLGEIKVYRGTKNYKDVGRVISVNGDTGENFAEFCLLGPRAL